MKKLMDVLPLLLVVVLLFGTACQSNKKKDAESANVTLFDKDLPEIKTLVNGEYFHQVCRRPICLDGGRQSRTGGFELAQSGYGGRI